MGNLNLDLKASPLVAGMFSDGETDIAEIYELIGGGAPNAAAAAVAALGGQPRLFAAIGNDQLGERLGIALERHGVAVHLAAKPVSTGRSINLSWTNGHCHFFSHLPNNRLLQAEDILDSFDGQQDLGAFLRADV